MARIHFAWDDRKATANRKKHGISFEEAQTVFHDEKARLIHAPEQSRDETRFVLLGMSVAFRVLLVCHCYLEDDSTIRIISARKATKNERTYYESQLP